LNRLFHKTASEERGIIHEEAVCLVPLCHHGPVCGLRHGRNRPRGTGKLVLYSSLTTSMIENMLAMFEADTGIKTECLAMGTGDAL